jgi:hypothetical protein
VRIRILNALLEEGKAMKKTLEEDVTGTWQHEAGFSVPHVQFRGGDALIAIATDDPIFKYLDEGTLVRWAALSSDWVSKTKASGSLKSGAGKGRVLRRGRKAGPHRGIEARNFSERVSQKHGPLLSKRIRDVLSQGLF